MALANPSVVACALNTWTKVANGVAGTTIHPWLNGRTIYSWTYRVAGDPAPSDNTDELRLNKSTNLCTDDTNTMDVYVYAKVAAGSVRVDNGLDVTYLIDG